MEKREEKLQSKKSKGVGHKCATAALASTLFLSGCHDASESSKADSDTDVSAEESSCEVLEESFGFAEGYDSRGVLTKDEVVEGPAIIKKNPDSNDIILIYAGGEYNLSDNAVVWKYEGDSREALDSQIQFFGEECEDISVDRVNPNEED